MGKVPVFIDFYSKKWYYYKQKVVFFRDYRKRGFTARQDEPELNQ